jgi:hypothetical protein
LILRNGIALKHLQNSFILAAKFPKWKNLKRLCDIYSSSMTWCTTYKSHLAGCVIIYATPKLIGFNVFFCWFAGPILITLCTVLFDLQNETWTVYRGNPQEQVIHSHDSLRLHST